MWCCDIWAISLAGYRDFVVITLYDLLQVKNDEGKKGMQVFILRMVLAWNHLKLFFTIWLSVAIICQSGWLNTMAINLECMLHEYKAC